MNSRELKTHGARVDQFARAVPNMGRLGDLTRAAVEMLRSSDWRDYSDATGSYHFLPGEFDYFLALQTVDARDVARFLLSPEERMELAQAMDHTRTGEESYRRTLEQVATEHPHAARSLTDYWGRFGWGDGKHPVSTRTLIRARTGVTPEEHARQTRMKRLRQLANGWRDRVARVVEAAEGFSREELLAAIEALQELAREAPKLAGAETWRRDAEELDWSDVECAKRWKVSRSTASSRLARLRAE